MARFPSRFLIGLALICIIIVLPGCTSRIELREAIVATPSPVATAVPQERAVAIVGVDFDPSLDYAQIAASGGVTLLVAVQNQGRMAESDVQVRAVLLDPEAKPSARELLNEVVHVTTLAPGEVRVIRFSQVSELPIRTRYRLDVQVDPVPGEIITSDNAHSYEITIGGEG